MTTTLPLWTANLPAVAGLDMNAAAHRRLDEAMAMARRIPYDNSSRFVFFSDAHRGDGGRTDAFHLNQPLFCHALSHYDREGFTYIEVGDGDELWGNRRFEAVRRVYEPTFRLLHHLDRQGRLYLLFGNHDIQGRRQRRMEKDGLVATEALLLVHRHDRQQILCVHGHQADFKSDRMYRVSRFMVRHIWRRVQCLGVRVLVGPGELGCSHRDPYRAHPAKWSLTTRLFDRAIRHCTTTIERRIASWIEDSKQIVICGHTHRRACAPDGGLPYFNTGHCLTPGLITGLEVEGGRITPMRWVAEFEAGSGKILSMSREVTGESRELAAYEPA